MKPFQWTVRMNYRYRIGSFLMLFAILGSHLLERDLGAGAWAALAAQFLLYPHVLYWRTLRAADLRRAELGNLLVDSFLFGVWAAVLGFPLWISFTLYASTLVNNGIYRGIVGVLLSLLVSLSGTLLGVLAGGWHFLPDTAWSTTLLCMTGLGIHLALTAGIAHARNQALYDTRAQLKASEQALQQANRGLQQQIMAKTRFLAYAGHDLRQPLQAMHLFLDSLANSPLDGRQQHLTQMLQSSAVALESLLDSLLHISKLDAGVIRPELQALDLDVLLTGLQQEFEPQARGKGLRLRLWLPDETVTVVTDENLLASLLRNLVSNAIKYTERGGVLLAVRRVGGRLRLQVWDTGIGISPADRQRIFDEFYQVDNPQRDRTRGLGLGLAIVQRIAGLLGLQVACRSRPGRGTVMEVLLPQAQADLAPTRTARPAGADMLDLRGRHVVLIEDTADVAMAQTVWLESCGACVTRFSDADSALNRLEELARTDFFLCDYRLPGQASGLDFLDALKARYGPGVHGALLTGDTSSDFIEMASGRGWPVLFKPVQAARLRQLLQPLTQNRA